MLLIVIMTDLKWFVPKSKPVIYTRTFVELYNLRKNRQVHEIHKMIKLEKIRALTAKSFCKLGAYQIIKILLSILYGIYIISRKQDKFVFNINNHIN